MVAKIKVHLQRFGYNAIAGAEEEKEIGLFDEKLEAAMRLYYSSFNLQVTGFLDAPTIQSLSLPREVESLEEAMIKIQFDGDSDSDEWVFEFIEGEHGDEDAKMKIDFLRHFLTEDDVAATLYENPPLGPGPPPPLLPKSCSHFA
ncbi:hypothetical protein SUGI_0933320 [Cryptomeria japonica]|nr:hypothetical protein SUGI_0933320 [Cryptomeria japonica]